MEFQRVTSQSGMETALRDYLAYTRDELRDTFNGKLQPELVECSYENQSVTVRFVPQDWMGNPQGAVHGGVTAAMVDFSMGILCRFLSDGCMTPTLDMQLTYLRAIPGSTPVLVRAKVTKMGRTVSNTVAELCTEAQPEKLCATATGSYFTQIGR